MNLTGWSSLKICKMTKRRELPAERTRERERREELEKFSEEKIAISGQPLKGLLKQDSRDQSSQNWLKAKRYAPFLESIYAPYNLEIAQFTCLF